MIDIRMTVHNKDCILVESTGHADYDDSGLDIVCAAVSALMINTANALEVLTADDFTVDEGDGYFCLSISPEASGEAHLLMNALSLGLHSVYDNYGTTYLDIATKEV